MLTALTPKKTSLPNHTDLFSLRIATQKAFPCRLVEEQNSVWVEHEIDSLTVCRQWASGQASDNFRVGWCAHSCEDFGAGVFTDVDHGLDLRTSGTRLAVKVQVVRTYAYENGARGCARVQSTSKLRR